MASKTKTISINPALFSVGKKKTKKAKDAKEAVTSKPKPLLTPIISPNVLKTKLLNRIKQHKQKEIKAAALSSKLYVKASINNHKLNHSNNSRNSRHSSRNSSLSSNGSNDDELLDSINYLQALSKEDAKQKHKSHLDKQTLKKYPPSMATPTPAKAIVELPDSLQINTRMAPLSIKPPSQILNDVPYGILKGGLKPTYKEWSRTQRNLSSSNSTNISSLLDSRENKLHNLRNKIHHRHQLSSDTPILNNMPNPTSTHTSSATNMVTSNMMGGNNNNNNNNSGQVIATKHITKKTIKRKYTLGRSKIKRMVSVLIKDRNTRKQITQAHTDLKRKNLNDIKTYLKEHNLIKSGAKTPTDVLRKMYESSMLAGEITNSNVDTMLHNFAEKEKDTE